jgi:hypothetical protein
MKRNTDQIHNRLEQLVREMINAHESAYFDRLRDFKHYCASTPMLVSCLAELPKATYNLKAGWRELEERWPEGEASYFYRWSAIRQIVDGGPDCLKVFWHQVMVKRRADAHNRLTKDFVIPLCDYLLHQIESSSLVLYLLWRYKRWAEWFKPERLRDIYNAKGEEGLDRNLRRFLFESGIDYPFSKPRSPRGEADIVGGLETDDPLVLEIKVWDSEKGYREDRVRDGLRQVVDYADKYGKDRGYVAVFNLDLEPLFFVGGERTDELPARIEHGSRTYYFIAINIAEQSKPVSQWDKGKHVRTNRIQLTGLWAMTEESRR